MSNRVSKHKSRRFRRFVRANEAVSALEYAILVGGQSVAVRSCVGSRSVIEGYRQHKHRNVRGCNVERHSDH